MNKRHYEMLQLLLEHNCMTELKSMTIKEMSKEIQLSMCQTRNIIKMLYILRFINLGAKQGKQNTYYLTPTGMKKIGENI